MLYRIPLILLIGGLILGMQIFNYNKELFSTLLPLGLILTYIFLAFTLLKKKKQNTSSHPEIIFVKPSQN